MEDLRKFHNDVKRRLIQSITRKGSYVLDVGCGFGGDLKKWAQCGAVLFACDPIKESLKEARTRAATMKIPVTFFDGDILSCPDQTFDIVCYNFSMHYIFKSRTVFFKSIHAIRKRMRTGSKLVGIIPDSESILMATPFKDHLGNIVVRASNTVGFGEFGEQILVELVDTPFYKDGMRPEPLAYKDLLVTHLEELGLRLESWQPLAPSGISGLYSAFIFVCL